MLPFRVPAAPLRWAGGAVRGGLRPARHRAAAAPAAGRVLDQEPRLLASRRRGGCWATRPRWTSRRASRAPRPGTGRRAGCERPRRPASCWPRWSSALLGAALRADLAGCRAAAVLGRRRHVLRMAWSLAEDGDLRYEARDVFRVRREFPDGPAGHLPEARQRRARAGPGRRLSRGSAACRRERSRASTSPSRSSTRLVAAPLVQAVRHARPAADERLCLGAGLVLGYSELRRSATPCRARWRCRRCALPGHRGARLPVWPAPELFNLAPDRRRALRLARASGRCSRRCSSASPTYSKPYNLWLAMPLGLEPLLPTAASAAGRARLLESARRGASWSAAIVRALRPERGRHGRVRTTRARERKTFYGTFPSSADLADGRGRSPSATAGSG